MDIQDNVEITQYIVSHHIRSYEIDKSYITCYVTLYKGLLDNAQRYASCSITLYNGLKDNGHSYLTLYKGL